MDETSLQTDNDRIEMRVSRKAPRFLDADGCVLAADPLHEAWKGIQEAFSRLHGQRLLEVMERVFQEMPDDERLHLEWESDETRIFLMRFSNGWALTDWTNFVDVDAPCPYADTQGEDHPAPSWFPRDERGFARWKSWHDVLHNYCIDPGVDAITQRRLTDLSEQLGGLEKSHLPQIKMALVGPEWSSALEHIDIHANTPSTNARLTKPRRM